MKTKDLTGRVVVITGASSGFGRGMALKFSEAGAHVVLASRSMDALQELVLECEHVSTGSPLAVRTDVSVQNDVEALSARTLAEYGKIDMWINNAGVAAIGRFEEVPMADHVQVIHTNLLGTIFGSHVALRRFRARRVGTLVNIASALGKIPAPYYASYTAAKYGIVGLGAALRQELDEHNLEDVHVCTVMPMAMDTPFFDHAANFTGRQSVPIPPLYDPQMVVDAIFELAFSPVDEVIVGGAGKMMNALHHVFPGMVERMMSHQTHSSQMDDAPAGADTHGIVHEASHGGEVSAGRLEEGNS